MFWQELIKTLGGFAILVAALAWLLKSITQHYLSKEVEAHKARLLAESTKEVENLKSQLQIIAKEHDIRFSKLHEKRAEIVSDLYFRLKDSQWNAELLGYAIKYETGRQPEKIAEDILKELVELHRFFYRNKLYFSIELADSMEELISILVQPSSAVWFYASSGQESLKQESQELLEAWNKEQPKINYIFELIEAEFRKMLGSEQKIGA
jgi:hypothetical protein